MRLIIAAPLPWPCRIWRAGCRGGLFALLIGTIQLSRALADRRLADEVLEQGIKNALALMDTIGESPGGPPRR